MSPDHTAVQFVCFETPLPRLAFVPGWVPFAGTFLAQGLRRIVLSERVARGGIGPSFDFISRNEWPEEAFARAAQAGRIGDGAGGPVRAAQGGTFRTSAPIPTHAQSDRDKVMALLRAPGRDVYALGQTIAAAFASASDTHVFLYSEAVTAHQRFDLIAEVYAAPGEGEAVATLLGRAAASAIDSASSTIAVYREVLTLPPHLPTL